jgi:hypothetical protein
MKEDFKSSKNAPEKTDAHPEVDRVETSEEHNQKVKTRLSEKNNATLIKYEELIDAAPEFALWLKELVRYGNVDSQVLILLDTKEMGKNRFVCRLYTNDHFYSISGYKSLEGNGGYLGCIASTRKNRVGEDWNRGSDLPDGKYSKKTFDAIVRGIVAYELKSLQLWRT